MEVLRSHRTGLISICDWTQGNDSPLSDAKKAEWAIYRQALRDLPANNPNPVWQDEDNTLLPDITWPTVPE